MDRVILKYSEDFEKHVDQIARLKTLNWDLDFDVFKSYVRWNYLERPHSRPPAIYFVCIGEEIVAMKGEYETTWQLKNASARFSALCPADLLILKEYRNKGIYRELDNYVMEDLSKTDIEYSLSFNATPLNTLISLSLGCKSLGQIEIMRKQILTRTHPLITLTKRLLKKFGVHKIIRRKARNNVQIIDSIHQSARTKPSSRILIENNPRPAEMARLLNRILPQDKITLVRDEKFFHWRYNNPLSKYLFLYWFDDDLKGYLVLQSHKYGDAAIGTYNIFELEATNSLIKIELLDFLLSITKSGSISVWKTMLDQETYNFAVSKGFVSDKTTPSAKEPPLTILIRQIDKDNDMRFQGLNLLDGGNWDLKMVYMHDH